MKKLRIIKRKETYVVQIAKEGFFGLKWIDMHDYLVSLESGGYQPVENTFFYNQDEAEKFCESYLNSQIKKPKTDIVKTYNTRPSDMYSFRPPPPPPKRIIKEDL